MPTIKVSLDERSYPIVIQRGLLASVGARTRALGFKGRAAVVTNAKVKKLYGGMVIESLKEAGIDPFVVTLPDGEEYKSLTIASRAYDSLVRHRMERSSPVIALGGGVIGDMTGFVAATYLRGVPYIQIPTTLLSQVDSSVGGKTAVNHPLGKNLIGAFYQPKAVFIDPDALNTLDKREVRGGLAEVVKYGVIWDPRFYSFLEKNASDLGALGNSITKAIVRSCAVKAEVVGIDETETGLRSILNYGHTFGHAIEAISGYGKYRHGEAVSIGMVMAAELSAMLGIAPVGLSERLRALLRALGLPVQPPAIKTGDFISAIRLDKKVVSGGIRFVLVKDIGRVITAGVSEDELRRFLAGR